MVIFNYKNLFKKYDREIKFYSNRVSFSDSLDHAQEIRIFILSHLNQFDPTKSSLKYYLHLIILTAYRRVVFDRTKQCVFEDSFSDLCSDIVVNLDYNSYDKFVSDIVVKLNHVIKIAIFYSVIYNKDSKNYTQIAKLLNMNYTSFLNYMQQIRKVVKEVMRENLI